MSTVLKLTVFLSLVIVVLVAALQVDDDLSPESQAMLDRVDWQTPNDSYPYFLGINAKLSADPLRVGNDILSELRELEANYPNIVSYEDIQSLSERETLDLDQHPQFCSLKDEQGCMSSLFLKTDLRLFSAEMRELKKRYLNFLSMDDFRSLSQPHIYEPFGPYSTLFKGNRLVSLSAIDLARSGQPQLAIQQLYSLLERQRHFSSKVDSLLARMIAYALINETIDVLALVIKEHDLDGHKIRALSVDELSLLSIASREFAFASSAVDIVRYDVSYKRWPRWIRRMLMKPNMTMNAASESYLRAIKMSVQGRPSFDDVDHSPRPAWFRNAVGTQLIQTAGVEFDGYVARGFDLNAKIALFNGTLNQWEKGHEINDETLTKISNPYYDQEFDAHVSEDQKRVCMSGPFDDYHQYRCLRIRL